MAEQHGAPEQAAAGKSHGGLGGSYKVQGSSQNLEPRAEDSSWVSGAQGHQESRDVASFLCDFVGVS